MRALLLAVVLAEGAAVALQEQKLDNLLSTAWICAALVGHHDHPLVLLFAHLNLFTVVDAVRTP